MGSVLMHVYPVNLLTIDITAQLATFVYHQTSLACLSCPVGECCPE